MLIGAHAILRSTNAEADRAFLKDVIGLPSVDAGGGWLIFGLPPSELAFHPADHSALGAEFFFMCADVSAFAAEMAAKGAACGPLEEMDWGVLTELTLPSGARVGVYEPRHPRPGSAKPKKAKGGKKGKRPGKTGAKKGAAKAAKPASGKKSKKKAARRGKKKPK